MRATDNAADRVTEQDLSQRITAVGAKLWEALNRLVSALPGHPHRPQDLARALGIDKSSAHRLVVALRQKDPLATAYLIPGPQPLRRFVKASIRKGLAPDLASQAEEAIDAFDGLIREEGGDRSALDAIISEWLPDMRAGFEKVAKQLVYRGMRQLRGVAADVVFYTALVHPSKDEARYDVVQIEGYMGLRRVRPSAELKMGVHSFVSVSSSAALTLDGEPVHDLRGVFLSDFCSGAPVELEVYEEGLYVVYGLKWGEAVGRNSARDLVRAELRRAALRRHRHANDARPKSGLSNAINVPSRTFISDLIMHADAYPDWLPRVKILETGEAGRADPNDATRELDVLDLTERVEELGWGIERFRAAEIPKYIDLLQHVCKKLNWNPERFRGYRTRIDYPIFGSQVQFAFDLPVGPDS